jgi:uncharacterized protein (DUF2164 family)
MAAEKNRDIISEEKRDELIRRIIDFFEVEREEKIGMIAAENILDFFLQNIGTEIYNQGISDSLTFLHVRFQDLELDMESILLKK